jgi:hypothetical protein
MNGRVGSAKSQAAHLRLASSSFTRRFAGAASLALVASALSAQLAVGQPGTTTQQQLQKLQDQRCAALKTELAELSAEQAGDQRNAGRSNPGSSAAGWGEAANMVGEEIAATEQQMILACRLVHAPPPGLPVVDVEGFEVTQAIQNLNNSVPLVAGKQTWVRVYVNPLSALTVNAILTVTRNGHVTTLTAPAALAFQPDPGGNLPSRKTWSQSLNIRLPDSLIGEGDATFNVTGVTDQTGKANVYTCGSGCGGPVKLTFLNQPPLVVRAIGMKYNIAAAGHPASYAVPRQIDFDYLRSWLGRAYPVASVTFSQRNVVLAEANGVTTATAQDVSSGTVDCNTADAQLAAIRAQDVDGGLDARTHYYGLVQVTGGYLRGCANGIPQTPDPSVTASGPSGQPASGGWEPINTGSESDQSFSGWYGGHELGHTFGRYHPGFCNGNSHDDTAFPNPNGWISKGKPRDFAGLDVGDPSLSLPPSVIPVTNFDIMTYCNQAQWLSAYSYEAVRKRLLAENPGFSTTGPNGAVRMINGQLVHIVAIVNLTHGQGRISYVAPVSTAAAVVEPSRRVSLVFKDAAGRVVTTEAAPLHEDTDTDRGKDHMALVDAAVPLPPGAAEVDLVLDGKTIAVYQPPAAEAPPQVRNLRIESAGQARLLRWDTTERLQANAPPTTYIVQGSHDGRSWETISVGAADLQAVLEDSAFQQVRVIASHGFTRSAPVVMRLGR